VDFNSLYSPCQLAPVPACLKTAWQGCQVGPTAGSEAASLPSFYSADLSPLLNPTETPATPLAHPHFPLFTHEQALCPQLGRGEECGASRRTQNVASAEATAGDGGTAVPGSACPGCTGGLPRLECRVYQKGAGDSGDLEALGLQVAVLQHLQGQAPGVPGGPSAVPQLVAAVEDPEVSGAAWESQLDCQLL